MRFSRGREFRIAQREFWRTAEAYSENKFINQEGDEGARRKALLLWIFFVLLRVLRGW
jgi:hypothetical protein